MLFFFVKQKTAYEMRISDWSSDVCSSDLRAVDHNHFLDVGERDFDSYWDARPGALRSTVDRKMAKFPVDLEIHDRFSPAIWKDYEAVYENSWKPEEGSLSFLRAIAEQEGEAGHLRMGIARRDRKSTRLNSSN